MPNDYYILFFSFPLRVNNIVPSGCLLSSGVSVGNLYYHWYNQAIVCQVVTSIPNPGINSTIPNVKFINFYTQYYYLSPN